MTELEDQLRQYGHWATRFHPRVNPEALRTKAETPAAQSASTGAIAGRARRTLQVASAALVLVLVGGGLVATTRRSEHRVGPTPT